MNKFSRQFIAPVLDLITPHEYIKKSLFFNPNQTTESRSKFPEIFSAILISAFFLILMTILYFVYQNSEVVDQTSSEKIIKEIKLPYSLLALLPLLFFWLLNQITITYIGLIDFLRLIKLEIYSFYALAILCLIRKFEGFSAIFSPISVFAFLTIFVCWYLLFFTRNQKLFMLEEENKIQEFFSTKYKLDFEKLISSATENHFKSIIINHDKKSLALAFFTIDKKQKERTLKYLTQDEKLIFEKNLQKKIQEKQIKFSQWSILLNLFKLKEHYP